MSLVLIPVNTEINYANLTKTLLYNTLIVKGLSPEQARSFRSYYIFYMAGIAFYGQLLYTPGTFHYLESDIKASTVLYRGYYNKLETLMQIFPEEKIIKTFIMWNMERRMEDRRGIQMLSHDKKVCREFLQRDLNKFFLFYRKLRILKLISIYQAILDKIPFIPEEIAIEITNYL